MTKTILILALAIAPLAADVKVVQLRYRPADSLYRILGIQAQPSPDFNTITLRGSAEEIKEAESVIAKYDTPRRQAEFLLRVVEAGSGAQGPNDAADLVPAELKTLLKYTRYGLMDSTVVRGMEADRLRIALGGNLAGSLRFVMRESALELEVELQGPPMNVKNSGGNDTTTYPTILRTTATMKSGETVVLGASKMRGGANALIVLLTAKLVP